MSVQWRTISLSKRSVRTLHCIHTEATKVSKKSVLLQRLADYQQKRAGKGGESGKDAWEQSGHILRWLEDFANEKGQRGNSTKWQTVEAMVKRMVEEDEPLAYLLG